MRNSLIYSERKTRLELATLSLGSVGCGWNVVERCGILPLLLGVMGGFGLVVWRGVDCNVLILF